MLREHLFPARDIVVHDELPRRGDRSPHGAAGQAVSPDPVRRRGARDPTHQLGAGRRHHPDQHPARLARGDAGKLVVKPAVRNLTSLKALRVTSRNLGASLMLLLLAQLMVCTAFSSPATP